MTDVMLPDLPQRSEDAHKGAVGRMLVIAGSSGMSGAGALVSMAALRSGAGLVTWAVPESLLTLAETLTLETIVLPLKETQGGAPGVDAREYIVEAAHEVDAVVVGPGLPVAGETGELLRLVVPEIRAPLVVDAGALTAIGNDWKILLKRKDPTVITPHPGEMARLVGKTTEDVQAAREKFATKYAGVSKAVVLLKGKDTLVTDGKEIYMNTTGNSGMATAGSGDVLAGVIGALLSQNMGAFDAACLAAHLHGMAGDIVAEEIGCHGLIASDLIDALPSAFLAYQEDKGE